MSRRIWSPEEEKVLLVSLKSLVAQGYKSDNGFRIGYLKKLEEAMKMEFPFSNIKAEPHIRSKLTAWKKTYGAIMSILSRSGVGFNVHGDEKIDADPEAWEEIIRVYLIKFTPIDFKYYFQSTNASFFMLKLSH